MASRKASRAEGQLNQATSREKTERFSLFNFQKNDRELDFAAFLCQNDLFQFFIKLSRRQEG
jgi:hypothetical protein